MIKIAKLFLLTLLLLTSEDITFSQTVYKWNGSVNSNFSTAGNWTPFRQVGLVTDILVFENSGTLNVTNVYQVTIGQLIVKNNTNLVLSPASGNAKLVTIKGTAGEDLVVESGSSLKITGNDPSLNFYLGTGATGTIHGSLSFEGSIAHYINAADAMALRFKQGSTFTQRSPGSIFNTTGVNNAIVFESGSSFRIDHSNALNPFGVNAPNSKVLFEESSNLVITNIASLNIAGRNIADLTIEPGTTINLTESFTSDISVNNVTVKSGASLTVKNTNSAYSPVFKILGNINSTGSFKFSSEIGSKFKVKFCGSSVQTISGAGEIIFPSNLEAFELNNNISLEKDLAVNCPIILNRFEIINNGFEFTYNPQFGNPFNGTKTIISNTGAIGGNLSVNSSIPSEYSISQNYPNPFNPSTKIDFSLPVDSKVSIRVFDITGKEIAVLVNSVVEAGVHTVNFNASELSSGIYFYTINAGSFTKTVKMVLAK